tara:strand:- start:1736 stop:3481 length:1746 start_codon:yes stop_codon:yes gene_type:complete
MRLLNLNKSLYIFTFLFVLIFPLKTEEPIDIWKKDQKIENKNKRTTSTDNEQPKIDIEKKTNSQNNDIEISKDIINSIEEKSIYGIVDPEDNNLSLDMWVQSDGKEIKDIFKRIDKITLSNSARELFTNIIVTYSHLPQTNMSDEEFLSLKINWLIKNKQDELLEKFLNKNEKFEGKQKIIQYLVDKNIAQANLNQGCQKIEFLNKEIKDSYLEKFKIYCLIFNDKKNEAQLVFDLFKEQGLSDKFFDKKINILLGINNNSDKEIKDNNLLNFYLSSITVADFNYVADEKTDKFIWEYLNAANLIKIDDIEDKEKIKNLEIAANNDTLNKEKIFQIYKKVPFDLNTLINAEGVYKSLETIDSRALVYQKYLLSDNVENKIKYLLILKDLFKKDDLSNVFTEFMSSKLKEIDEDKIPEEYAEVVKKNIVSIEEYKLGKIKYDDKVLHRSKVIKFYTEEGASVQKTQKDLNNVYKKIKRNKDYFFSAKDLILIEALEKDGFKIPKEIKHKEAAKRYGVPESLLELANNNEIGLLALKFVEIIGEDEISDLDPETIYFITNILNKAGIIKLRNKLLVTALPLRT